MANAAPAPKNDVAHIAGRVLNAFRSAREAKLQSALTQASRRIQKMPPLDTYERERLEALEAVMLSLRSPVQYRVQAAAHLLEQLAGVDSKTISRRSPRS